MKQKMIEKTFFIHAGGSKTGSSALQNFFELNYSRLESAGFAYENRLKIQSEYEINCGNGMLLYKALSSTDSKDAIDSLVLSYFDKFQNAICSSEYFAVLAAADWRKLVESSERLGVQLKVIFYVRNVIPYLLSDYDQAIKGLGEYRSFDEWVKNPFWQHFMALETISAELPRASIHVVHFDLKKNSLISSFLDILGIDNSFKVDANDQKKQINRSFSLEERELLKSVNKRFGEKYSRELSYLLIYANPNFKVEPELYSKATADLLLARFNDQADWINNTFFNHQKIVLVLPSNSSQKELDRKSINKSEIEESVDKQVLVWSLDKLKTIREETARSILTTLNDAAQNNVENSHPNIPADFDLLAYLLLNQDVLLSKTNPIAHFIGNGINEKRRYKFSKQEIFASETTYVADKLPTANDDLKDTKNIDLSMLNYRIETLTQALKQWQNYAKETSKKAAQRERELYEQLLPALKDKVND